MHHVLIGLMGPAGAGKDTARQMLEDEFGFEGLAFADPMRQMIGALLTCAHQHHAWMTERALKEQPIPGLGVSYRHLAQELGGGFAANVDEQLWVRIAQASVNAMHATGTARIVISDVRHEREANWIRAQGGHIWLLQRDAREPVRPHESEQAYRRVTPDRVIDNNGALDALWVQLSDLVEQLVGVEA